MKKIALIILAVFTVCMLNGENIGVLTEVLNPDQLRVAGDRCYILQGETVFIYSLKDLKLIKQFGKKGEGPGEVMTIAFISNNLAVQDNKLVVDAINKVIFFSRDGVFEKEVRKKGQVANVLPVGDGFVITRLRPDEERKKLYAAVTLVDAEMNVSKELHAEPVAQQGRDVQLVPDGANMAVYEDKIFVEKSTEGFVIDVYDSKGNELYKIRKDIPPLTVTTEIKERLLKEFIEDRAVQFQMTQTGEAWDEFKKRINLHYPDTLPHIRDILVKEGKIYIRTFITNDGKEKYLILDLKGKELKTVFLPKPILAPLVTRIVSRPVRLFDIANDRYYYIVENEDEEEWELHVEPIR